MKSKAVFSFMLLLAVSAAAQGQTNSFPGTGNVGVGTPNPQAKLAVEGTILAREVKVKTDISVPDYVFEPDYELPTLSEVEAYVKKHRHLPEIPSAADKEREGMVDAIAKIVNH